MYLPFPLDLTFLFDLIWLYLILTVLPVCVSHRTHMHTNPWEKLLCWLLVGEGGGYKGRIKKLERNCIGLQEMLLNKLIQMRSSSHYIIIRILSGRHNVSISFLFMQQVATFVHKGEQTVHVCFVSCLFWFRLILYCQEPEKPGAIVRWHSPQSSGVLLGTVAAKCFHKWR